MEASVVCVDNSEWTRNGDYPPDRFECQKDAVNLLAGAKTQANAENGVGILTMAGRQPNMLVTPTPELGKVLNCMATIKIEGEATYLLISVQIAQLALKHRVNKNMRQKIIIFIGSPIIETKEALVKIAKKLKKNNVAVDIVSFGCVEENNEKLEAFHNAVLNSGNSFYERVPEGMVLSDTLIATPIFQGENVTGDFGPGTSGVNIGNDFGVDAELDPELALALRVSLEEEQARQLRAAAEAEAATDNQTTTEATNEGGETAAEAKNETTVVMSNEEEEDEVIDDPVLREAIALSMQAMVETKEENKGMSEAGTSGEGTGGGEASSAKKSQSERNEKFVAKIISALPEMDIDEEDAKKSETKKEDNNGENENDKTSKKEDRNP